MQIAQLNTPYTSVVPKRVPLHEIDKVQSDTVPEECTWET